jgi:hypothetical protein
LEVYGITGNESRVKPELGWSDELATDSYDLMIYAILRRGFEGVDGNAFCGFQHLRRRQRDFFLINPQITDALLEN